MTNETTMAAFGSTGGLGGALHPWCLTCGWRKGGTDSWSGKACKCGLWEPPIVRDAAKEHPSDFNQPPTLRCARCRDVFERPFAEFFFRDRNGPFGWRKWCKACYSEAPSILKRSRPAAALVTPNVRLTGGPPDATNTPDAGGPSSAVAGYACGPGGNAQW